MFHWNHSLIFTIGLMMANSSANILGLSWYKPIPSSNVIKCQVRTAVFHEANDRHVTKQRCEALDEVGVSKGVLYDIPQWLVDKYPRGFMQHSNMFLSIERARFARHDSIIRNDGTVLDGRGRDQIFADVGAEVAFYEEPFGFESTRRRAVAMSGESNVLVVRVSTVDRSVGLNSSTISSRVFGSYGTPASQYKACSMGKKQLLPATGPGILGGVLEMAVNATIQGVFASDLENTLNNVLSTIVPHFDDYQHIIYCLPRGSLGSFGESDWIAYAYIDWNRAYFNDDACRYLSNYVHELGHNMGLGHSGKDNAIYGDQSGIMGIGYAREFGPLRCFNSAKNWQLGWYNDKAIELQERSSCGPWKGRLYGFTDFLSVPTKGVVLIKIGDIFIQFNKIAAMNRDTPEKANVVAFTLSSGDVNSISWSLDGRDSGTFEYERLRVDVCGKLVENGLEYFDIVVRNQTQSSICRSDYTTACVPFVPMSIPTAPPTNTIITTSPAKPSVPQPSQSPTKAMTAYPTKSPTEKGTNIPTLPLSVSPNSTPTHRPSMPNPSYAPTIFSTRSPALTPRPSPILSPTFSPTSSPTLGSTLFPTNTPTSKPSVAPTNVSTMAPTPNPTKAPVSTSAPTPPTGRPTLEPTSNFTKVPTSIPTQTPTRIPTQSPKLNPTMFPTKGPSPNPTKVPSKGPTSSPINIPTPSPTRFLPFPPTLYPTKVPTRYPTQVPTKANVVETNCDDNLTGTFLYPGLGGFLRARDCLWLRARPFLKESVCSTNDVAFRLCAETCGKCVDDCFDTQQEFLFQGANRTCYWLSMRLGVIQEVCHFGQSAFAACPETCGACDGLVGNP